MPDLQALLGAATNALPRELVGIDLGGIPASNDRSPAGILASGGASVAGRPPSGEGPMTPAPGFSRESLSLLTLPFCVNDDSSFCFRSWLAPLGVTISSLFWHPCFLPVRKASFETDCLELIRV